MNTLAYVKKKTNSVKLGHKIKFWSGGFFKTTYVITVYIVNTVIFRKFRVS